MGNDVCTWLINSVSFEVAPAGRSLRDAILNGDITTAARTLVQSLDRNGLIAGLTAPDGFQLRKSPISRDKDPDVTAVKGIAQAALTDSGQIAKYVDVILKAALPKGVIQSIVDQTLNSSYIVIVVCTRSIKLSTVLGYICLSTFNSYQLFFALDYDFPLFPNIGRCFKHSSCSYADLHKFDANTQKLGE